MKVNCENGCLYMEEVLSQKFVRHEAAMVRVAAFLGSYYATRQVKI